MPREKAADKRRREKEELDAHNAKLKAGYPMRLLAALEGATAEGWSIRFINAENGFRRLSPDDDNVSRLHTMKRIVRVEARMSTGGCENLDMPSLPPDDGYSCELTSLEDALRSAQELRERMERREQLRRDARSKLTDEEAEALGLRVDD
jgi:hypothetical protein